MKKLMAILLAVVMLLPTLSSPVFTVDVKAAEEYTGTGTFAQCTGTLTSGYYVFGDGSANSIAALNTDTSSNNWIKFTQTTSTSGTITNPDVSIVWYYDAEAGTFNNGTKYVAWPTSGNSAFLKDAGTPLTITETATAGVYNIAVTATPGRMLRHNGASGYRFYTSSTGTNNFYFFKLQEAAHEHSYAWNNEVGVDGSHTLTCANTDGKCDALTTTEECTWEDGFCSVCGAAAPECAHPTTEEVAEVPATCTEIGYTAGVQCTVCNQYTSGHDEIEALGHNLVTDAAVDATCTETGLTEGSHCDREGCGHIEVKQDVIEALGHNYVDGECTRCHEKLPSTLTITRDSFGDASGYAWHAWTATTTYGDTISGNGFIYGSEKTHIQVNAKTAANGNYIYNSVALPGNIISIKVTAGKTTYRNFVVITSDTPFDSTTNRLTAPDGSVSQLVNAEGATWTFTTDHKYFAVIAPDAGAAYLSSIEIEYFNCSHANTEAIGEDKAATCTEAGSTAGLKCLDCGEILREATEIEAFGHTDVDPVDNKCDTCGETLCTEHVWIDGEVITEGDCTNDRVVAQVCQNCGEPGEDKVITAPGHTEVTDEAKAPTCTETGLTEGSHCEVCEFVIVEQEPVAALGHTWGGHTCTVCNETRTVYSKVDYSTLADGDKIVIYHPANGLILSGKVDGTKLAGVNATVDGFAVYANNADELALTVHKDGNGDFYFETADGKYLTSGATGNSLTLEAELTDYAKWYFDTAGTTATLRIVNRNAKYNENAQALEYYNGVFTVYGLGDTEAFNLEIYKYCEHTNIVAAGESKDATCTDAGITAGEKCADCGNIIKEQEEIEALGHIDENPADSKCDRCQASLCTEHVWIEGDVITEGDCTTDRVVAQVCENCGEPGEDKVITAPGHTEEVDAAVAPGCTTTGLTEGKHCSVCNEVLTKQEEIPAEGHKYENGTCSVCGVAEVVNTKYTFADYPAGTQYAENEVHVLDETLTLTTTEAHFTSELRLYSSDAHNAFAIFTSAKPITSIVINAGNKADTLNVYTSTNGIDWTLAEGVGTSTSYADYTVTFEKATKYIKLDVAGTQQVRIKYISVEYKTPVMPKIYTRDVLLTTSIAINYYVPSAPFDNGDYTNPQISINGGAWQNLTTKVEIADQQNAGAQISAYKFTFNGVNPASVSTSINISLRATDSNGEVVVCHETTDSIANYLNDLKNNEACTEALEEVADKLLHFGNAAAGAPTSTPENYSANTTDSRDVAFTGANVAGYAWRSANLTLNDCIDFKFKFKAPAELEIDKLNVNILYGKPDDGNSVGNLIGSDYTVTLDSVDNSGNHIYILRFNQMSAADLFYNVKVDVAYNGETVLKSLIYSTGAYANRIATQSSFDDAQKTTINAMMEYIIAVGKLVEGANFDPARFAN